MSLLSNQACFLADVCRLLTFIGGVGLLVTGGELYRTKEQQAMYLKQGKSATANSMHLKRCAIDLNIFRVVNGKFQELSDPLLWQQIGKYWKSLDEKNRWGGDWKKPRDPWHFERNV